MGREAGGYFNNNINVREADRSNECEIRTQLALKGENKDN